MVCNVGGTVHPDQIVSKPRYTLVSPSVHMNWLIQTSGNIYRKPEPAKHFLLAHRKLNVSFPRYFGSAYPWLVFVCWPLQNENKEAMDE